MTNRDTSGEAKFRAIDFILVSISTGSFLLAALALGFSYFVWQDTDKLVRPALRPFVTIGTADLLKTQIPPKDGRPYYQLHVKIKNNGKNPFDKMKIKREIYYERKLLGTRFIDGVNPIAPNSDLKFKMGFWLEEWAIKKGLLFRFVCHYDDALRSSNRYGQTLWLFYPGKGRDLLSPSAELIGELINLPANEDASTN